MVVKVERSPCRKCFILHTKSRKISMQKVLHTTMEYYNAPVPLPRTRTNGQFELVRVIIPGHSSYDDDNWFEQRSSRACSLGRPVQSFWTCSKSCPPSTKNLHSCLCALRTCSYRVCRTTYVLYSGRFSLYTASFVHVDFRRTECECDSIEKRTESSSYYFRTIHERFENDSHW